MTKYTLVSLRRKTLVKGGEIAYRLLRGVALGWGSRSRSQNQRLGWWWSCCCRHWSQSQLPPPPWGRCPSVLGTLGCRRAQACVSEACAQPLLMQLSWVEVQFRCLWLVEFMLLFAFILSSSKAEKCRFVFVFVFLFCYRKAEVTRWETK